jgi:glycosyltransferase involved in cell wall biosynthesis
MNIEGVNLIVINAGDSNKYRVMKRAFRALLFALVSSYYSITVKADVLIASSGPITVGIPGILGKIFSRKKLVFEVRDLWPGGAVEMGLIKSNLIKKLFFWFEWMCYRNSSLVIPCSIGMQKDINSRHNNVRCEVIPNACDNNLFQNLNTSEYSYPSWVNPESIVLLYTGSLGLMDACDEIIHGFQMLQGMSNVHLVFIGDGTERRSLEELTQQYSLENHIHFLGLIPKTEVVQWYKIARVSFVVFKDYRVLGTSSPNKMFDSLAAGVPIIQNTMGWIKEVVEKEKIGCNVLPNNSQSMSDAIEYFVRLGAETAEFRKNSLLCARTKFDRGSLSLQYYEHLKQLK